MELFKLFGTIAVNNQAANSAIDETTDKAEKSHGGISSAFGKIGNAAVKVGKVVATGLGVAAVAIGAIAKQSIESYAEYEQLVGGVDTLFKESSEKVQEYAARAYQTASMSANEYMSTVTSFSASLLQGLNGDTAKAAEIADMAIQDMSDNANKMGTDMAAIQNAYQGFAKQNYTMLDNLKLGYGGTREEMVRLLRDAQKLTGIKYDINNLSDVYSAIHAIQVEMDIYGTTAKEASTTIQGSFAATKAAWQNLLTGFADESADIGVLIGNLIESGFTALNNVLPLIPVIVSKIAEGLVHAFPVLLQTVKNLFGQIWDYIALELLGTEADFASSFAKIQQLFTFLWSMLQGTWETLGQPIWNAIQGCVSIVKEVFAEYMPEIQGFVSHCFDDIRMFWQQNLKPCFDAIGNFIETVLAPIFEFVFEAKIRQVVATTFGFIKSLWEGTLKPVFTGITDFLTGVFTGNWAQAWNGIKSILAGILNGIITGIETMINSAINGINGLIHGINDMAVVEAISKALGVDGIPTIPPITLNKLAKGGVLEKGQMGFLEGDGAEAVVPLDQNKKWISAVAQDMDAAVGGGHELREMKEAFADFVDALPDMLVDAFASMKFDVNNREFARLVKAVN